MSDVKQQKTEILSKMRELQKSYSEAAQELKALEADEEKVKYEARQLERLESYKTKYKFYAKPDGSVVPVDWDEVEKCVRASFGKQGGYALGFDQTGMEGLALDYGQGGSFSPMVEEERDARIYAEQEARRQEFLARAKKKG